MKRENISKIFLEEKKKEENDLLKRNINEKKIMKEIELKTEKKIILELSSENICNPLIKKDDVCLKHSQDVLQSILIESSKEFKEKMGRNMSYSEMRELYG